MTACCQHSPEQISHLRGALSRCIRRLDGSGAESRYHHGMITAWSPPRMLWARAAAGRLLRVLGLAVLLFGVVFTHGLHAEGVPGHSVTSSAVPSTVLFVEPHDASGTQASSGLVATGDGRDDHGSSYPGEHCVAGQPLPGPVVAAPCFAASTSEAATAERTPTNQRLGPPEPDSAASGALRSSVVQQV